MSYILEALRKAEKERKQDGTTGSQSLDGCPPAFPTPPSMWSGRALGIILLLLILVGGIYGYKSMSSRTDPAKVAADKAAIEVQSETPERSPLRKPVIDNVADIDAQTVIRPLTIKSDRRKTRMQVLTKLPAGKPPAKILTNDNTDTLPFFHELPEEIQAGVPALKFAGHTYSATPQNRMIIINGKILKEGDQIDTTSKLEEITWEGVVIESKGVRFRKNNQ